MMSKEQTQGYLKSIADILPTKYTADYQSALNRVNYEFAKISGVKPKLYMYNKKKPSINDFYVCGNCGSSAIRIEYNYCPNCGYNLLWDSPRCLTK